MQTLELAEAIREREAAHQAAAQTAELARTSLQTALNGLAEKCQRMDLWTRFGRAGLPPRKAG